MEEKESKQKLKMKKPVKILIFLMIGGLVTAIIDSVLGVSFGEVSFFFQVAHKVTYMGWGAIVVYWGLK